jgi:hypothetical protein
MPGGEQATCVALEIVGGSGPALLRLVEGALGWQVVATGDPVLPARCRIVDVAGAPSAPAHDTGVDWSVPTVLVVEADDDPGRAARAALHVAAVVGPSPTADDLHVAVAGLADARVAGAPPWLLVGAAAGGVGASTVAAALAGLRAWTHGATLLVVSGPTHVPDAPVIALDELASPAAWAAAVPVPAVPDLRVVGLRAAGMPRRAPMDGPRTPAGDASGLPVLPTVAGPPAVVEVGMVGAGVLALDVLVARADLAGLAAVESAVGAPSIVLVGDGPVAASRFARVARGRVVRVPTSARVAAAAAAGRLPAALPGRWLRPLVPLVDDRAGS